MGLPFASVNDLARELIDQLWLGPVTAADCDKLHKLLYYVQGHHAAVRGRPLFAEPIEAADSGPVVAGFTGVDLAAPRGRLDTAVLHTVGYVVSRYGQLSPLDLRHLTRAEPPWQAGRRAPDRQIPLAAMIAYFRGDEAPAAVPEHSSGYPMAPPRPGNKRKWSWIIGGLVLAMILGYVGLFTVIGLGAADGTKVADAAAGQMGQPARDGLFEFTVTDLDCSQKVIGDVAFNGTARGIYCVVTVRVKNLDRQPQSFDESSQRAYDEQGTAYSHDVNAEFKVNAGAQTWFQTIEPGAQVTGKLVFDIPESVRVAAIELHDSPASTGVRVPLR